MCGFIQKHYYNTWLPQNLWHKMFVCCVICRCGSLALKACRIRSPAFISHLCSFMSIKCGGSPLLKTLPHTYAQAPSGLRTGHVNLITWPRAVWDTWGYRIRPTAQRGAAAPWN